MNDLLSTSSTVLKQWMDRGEVVLIDVRQPSEYMAGHIKGSQLIPLGKISAAAVPTLAGKKLVIQCKSGGRSALACAKLVAENPALSPYNLVDGILGWAREGLPVET